MVEQNIEIFPILEYIGLTLTIIVSSMVIGRSIKNGYQKYIDQQISMMNIYVSNIEREVAELKKDNQREHDEIKRDLLNRLDQIWNWIQKKG